MRLDPAGTQVDIHQRFREEVRALPARISLVGNPMQIATATALLSRHAPDIIVTDDGTPAQLMSLESYGAAFLAAFVENSDPPQPPLLLHTIPEDLLVAYAQVEGIPVVREERTAIRDMLDRIAAEQPQTYFSLGRSAGRLAEQAERLRKR